MTKLLKMLVAAFMCLGAVYAYGETQSEDKNGATWYYTVDEIFVLFDVRAAVHDGGMSPSAEKFADLGKFKLQIIPADIHRNIARIGYFSRS